eukprot:gene37993-15445_t
MWSPYPSERTRTVLTRRGVQGLLHAVSFTAILITIASSAVLFTAASTAVEFLVTYAIPNSALYSAYKNELTDDIGDMEDRLGHAVVVDSVLTRTMADARFQELLHARFCRVFLPPDAIEWFTALAQLRWLPADGRNMRRRRAAERCLAALRDMTRPA